MGIGTGSEEFMWLGFTITDYNPYRSREPKRMVYIDDTGKNSNVERGGRRW